MQNLTSLTKMQRFHQQTAKQKLRSQLSSGFTLIEILVVVLMMGILAAIAAPGWLAFVSRQRVNKASDAVLSSLQEAQRQAKKTKLSYSVSFRNNSQIPEIAIYPAQDPNSNYITAPSNAWNKLGGDLGLKSGQVIIGTNFTTTSANSKGASPSSVSYTPTPAGTKLNTTAQTITFNYLGALDLTLDTQTQTSNLSTTGLIVTVAAPQPGDPTQPTGTKRCVIIQTLLGGMRTAKDADCN